jgi:dephospho-CoA kinase
MIANIAFVGGAGAGKTTAADVLVDRFPDLAYERISFAEPLKIMLDTITDRQRLQEFGTDVVRAYEPEAWVRLFLWHLDLKAEIRKQTIIAKTRGRAADAAWFNVHWVNDDCRFENELAMLVDTGWWIIEVLAPLQTRIDRLTRNGKLSDPTELEHSSERSLGALVPHAVLVNNGTEDELADELAEILETLQRR